MILMKMALYHDAAQYRMHLTLLARPNLGTMVGAVPMPTAFPLGNTASGAADALRWTASEKQRL